MIEDPKAFVATKVFAIPSPSGCVLRVLSVDEMRVANVREALQDQLDAKPIHFEDSYEKLLERLRRLDKEASAADFDVSYRGIEIESPEMTVVLETAGDYWRLDELTSKVEKVTGPSQKRVSGLYLAINQTDAVAFREGVLVFVTEDTRRILKATEVVTGVLAQDSQRV